MNIKIKGNETTRNELKKIVQNNNVLHSYLFLGKEGIGKKEIAKEIVSDNNSEGVLEAFNKFILK